MSKVANSNVHAVFVFFLRCHVLVSYCWRPDIQGLPIASETLVNLSCLSLSQLIAVYVLSCFALNFCSANLKDSLRGL